jgi:GDP-L-fucose synthase
MPTNLYGPGDNFNLEKSHVLPALLRKIHLGKCLEEGNWNGIKKDLNKNPIDGVNGSSEKNAILTIIDKYGIRLETGSSLVKVNVWGTGSPLREFMYSPDMAEACVFVMENADITDIVKMNQSVTGNNPPHFLNIGTGEEISIKELALKIKKLIGFKGDIIFDSKKPDGTMRKTTDIGLLRKLGYTHKFNLDAGLAETYKKYLENA